MSESTLNRVRKQGMVVVAAGVLALSGCAATGGNNADLAAMQASIDKAAADAAAAKADAAAAKATAADALRTANEAKARSEDTETRIDRMFKKAMHK